MAKNLITGWDVKDMEVRPRDNYEMAHPVFISPELGKTLDDYVPHIIKIQS